jgi:hypothetical protein
MEADVEEINGENALHEDCRFIMNRYYIMQACSKEIGGYLRWYRHFSKICQRLVPESFVRI